MVEFILSHTLSKCVFPLALAVFLIDYRTEGTCQLQSTFIDYSWLLLWKSQCLVYCLLMLPCNMHVCAVFKEWFCVNIFVDSRSWQLVRWRRQQAQWVLNCQTQLRCLCPILTTITTVRHSLLESWPLMHRFNRNCYPVGVSRYVACRTIVTVTVLVSCGSFCLNCCVDAEFYYHFCT